MTMTTIKVPSELRDVLKAQAKEHGRSIGSHLQVLAGLEARRGRLARMRKAMETNPPDAEYTADASDWQGPAWS